MKISTLFIAGSVSVNVALIAILVAGSAEEAKPHPHGTAAQAAANARPIHDVAAASDFATWAALQADDLHVERERLRAEGFSPQMIRAILSAQIRESFSARRKALDAAQADTPFWKNVTPDPKTM